MKQIRKFYVKSGRLITYYPFKIKGKKNIDKIRKSIMAQLSRQKFDVFIMN